MGAAEEYWFYESAFPEIRQPGRATFLRGKIEMNLFRKAPPAACPRCGKKDSWRCMPVNESAGAAAGNPFAPAPIRNTFGQNLTGMKGVSKRLRYHCDSCGYEKAY